MGPYWPHEPCYQGTWSNAWRIVNRTVRNKVQWNLNENILFVFLSTKGMKHRLWNGGQFVQAATCSLSNYRRLFYSSCVLLASVGLVSGVTSPFDINDDMATETAATDFNTTRFNDAELTPLDLFVALKSERYPEYYMPPRPDKSRYSRCQSTLIPQIARFMGPTWGPTGTDRTQVGPMNFAIWVMIPPPLPTKWYTILVPIFLKKGYFFQWEARIREAKKGGHFSGMSPRHVE